MIDLRFEADHFTACNCDGGCAGNLDSRPTEVCGAWSIPKGRLSATSLDRTRFAVFGRFPSPAERGQGTVRTFIDSPTSPDQRQARATTGTGKVGISMLGLFDAEHVATKRPSKIVPTGLEFHDGTGRVHIGDVAEAESDSPGDPESTVIRPWTELPQGSRVQAGPPDEREALALARRGLAGQPRRQASRHRPGGVHSGRVRGLIMLGHASLTSRPDAQPSRCDAPVVARSATAPGRPRGMVTRPVPPVVAEDGGRPRVRIGRPDAKPTGADPFAGDMGTSAAIA